jgi:hypothetical protein
VSMENGFELDLDCGFGCMPMDHGLIGEPDFASIDEMPRPFVPEAVRETDYWERTETVIEQLPGHDTHKVSFVTKTRYGNDTSSVRLTKDELVHTFRVLGEYLVELLGV